MVYIYIYIRLEPETSVYKWLFQLDDSKPLHKKWWFHHLHPFKTGCLGFQVYIIMPWFQPQAMSDQHLRDLLTSARPTWTCKAPEIRKINGEKRVVMLIGEVKDDDYPIIYRVSYIPGGAGFQPSTVPPNFWGIKQCKCMVNMRDFL